jgi:hypothetical protein
LSCGRAIGSAESPMALPPIAGVAEIREDEQSIRELNDAMVFKYGLLFWLVVLAERFLERRGRTRIVLRITEPTWP